MTYQFRLPRLVHMPIRYFYAKLENLLGKLSTTVWVDFQERPMSCFLFFLIFKFNLTFKSLPETENDIHPIVQGEFCFGDDEIIGFFQDGSSLRVSQNNPLEADVLQVFWRYFASICTISIIWGVLGSYLNIFVCVKLLNQRNVQCDWSDNDIYS